MGCHCHGHCASCCPFHVCPYDRIRCPRCGCLIDNHHYGWHNCTPWRWNRVSAPTNQVELNRVIAQLGG